MACLALSCEKETDLKQKYRKLHKFVINKPMRNKTRNYTKVTQRQLGLENCMA
jgi:hypothetical protein